MGVNMSEAIELFQEFCNLIENTGGVIDDPEGSGCPVPVSDPEWIDLGVFYKDAADFLDRSGHPRPSSETNS